MMRYLKVLASMLIAIAALHPTSATARNYDCTKAGNTNKAVCKEAAARAAPATPAATPAAPTTTTPTPGTVRHYDCTKAGNANKTVCKNAAAPVAAAAAPAVPARSIPASSPVTRSTTSDDIGPHSTGTRSSVQ